MRKMICPTNLSKAKANAKKIWFGEEMFTLISVSTVQGKTLNGAISENIFCGRKSHLDFRVNGTGQDPGQSNFRKT